MDMLAEGSCGERRTERAASAATVKATVVKKPNTFCALTRVECIVDGSSQQSTMSGIKYQVKTLFVAALPSV